LKEETQEKHKGIILIIDNVSIFMLNLYPVYATYYSIHNLTQYSKIEIKIDKDRKNIKEDNTHIRG
jgi:hypothetical protein